MNNSGAFLHCLPLEKGKCRQIHISKLSFLSRQAMQRSPIKKCFKIYSFGKNWASRNSAETRLDSLAW